MFLISIDGAVLDADDTIAEVKAHYSSTRVFAVGIGFADKLLVEGLAKAGN
jgi:hypothetical protein